MADLAFDAGGVGDGVDDVVVAFANGGDVVAAASDAVVLADYVNEGKEGDEMEVPYRVSLHDHAVAAKKTVAEVVGELGSKSLLGGQKLDLKEEVAVHAKLRLHKFD